MGLKQLLKPRPGKFLQSLIRQAEITLQGMDALEAYMKKRSKYAARVVQAEKDADKVRRILVDDLNRTFVTPITSATAPTAETQLPTYSRTLW